MTVMGEPLLEFDFQGEALVRLFRRRLETLFATVAGTCPGDRNFGLSDDYQDEPPDVAESTFSLEVYNKTEEYIPEIEILDIEFEYDFEGGMRPRILVGLNEEYDDEYGDEDDEDGQEGEWLWE